jgi:hypothetical protein
MACGKALQMDLWLDERRGKMKEYASVFEMDFLMGVWSEPWTESEWV